MYTLKSHNFTIQYRELALTRTEMSCTHHGLSNALSLIYVRALDVHNITRGHFGGHPTSQVARDRMITIVVFAMANELCESR